MPIAITTLPVTAHRPRPVMKRAADDNQQKTETASMLRSISTTSVAIELDQSLVADPEVMRDLVEHDMPDLAA